jgi:hypothetical protein
MLWARRPERDDRLTINASVTDVDNVTSTRGL